MATQTVGTNLTVDSSPEARALSLSLTKYIMKFNSINGRTVTLYDGKTDCRVFKKAGAPVTNTSADSPGGDMCLVMDYTANDLYLIYAWSAAGTFTALKILEATAT